MPTDRRPKHNSNNLRQAEISARVLKLPILPPSQHQLEQEPTWAHLIDWSWYRLNSKPSGSASIQITVGGREPHSCVTQSAFLIKRSRSRRKKTEHKSLSKYSTPYATWKTTTHCWSPPATTDRVVRSRISSTREIRIWSKVLTICRATYIQLP